MHKRQILIRAGIIFAVIIFCLISLLPTIRWSTLSKEDKKYKYTSDEINDMRKNSIKLGLDLQGGMHLLLGVDTRQIPDDDINDAVERAITTIRSRIDEFGVSEPIIRKEGTKNILVELPGIDEPERALNIIKETAFLEFRAVDEKASEKVYRYLDENDKLLPDARLPRNVELMHDEIINEAGKIEKIPLLIKKTVLLTGEHLKQAKMEFDELGRPRVTFVLKKKGARQFDRITAELTGKRLAIVLSGKLKTAPWVKERIRDGSAFISGGKMTVEEAKDLALILRSGALPAPVEVLQNEIVGSTLGEDSIKKGVNSIIIGILALFIFLLFYYKFSGLIVNIALVLNFIIILGIMTLFNFTLTLPGIAGLILTTGMAVDANVLIYERTKEELKEGKTPRSAIFSGYSKALLTILDANITTLIVAIILFYFGTGAIKGFAITLTVGILASLFTSLVFTRMALDFIVYNFKVKKLSI